MAKTERRERLGSEEQLFEEAFLLAVQAQIQGLLNDKQLRFRDLSKRLGVSEARVSQMLGDEGANLTIRTIARIFHQLGEKPLIMSQRAFDVAVAGRMSEAWAMLAVDARQFASTQVEIVEEDDLACDPSTSTEDWLQAGASLATRLG